MRFFALLKMAASRFYVILERSEPTVDARGVSRGAKVKDLKVVNKEIFRFAQNDKFAA